MYELGDSAEEMHREIGKYCATSGVDILVVAGEYAAAMTDEASKSGMDGNCYSAADAIGAASIVSKLVRFGDTLLFKGSRAMRMEDCMHRVLEDNK